MTCRVCIVTNAPISQNPRVVKEADALSAAGFEVTVLFVQYQSWTMDMDEAIVRRASWDAVITQAIGQSLAERIVAFGRKLRAKVSEWLCRLAIVRPFSTWAYSRFYSAQLAQAVATDANLFIGHNPQSLPVVAHAAEKMGNQYAFDAEDFHTGQYPEEEFDWMINRLLREVEARYLPNALYVTGASFGITRALEARYGLSHTETILNVFPVELGDSYQAEQLSNDRKNDRQRVSLYWYSQIIGADRGLQTLLVALAGMSDVYELHLRGHVDEDVRQSLITLAGAGDFASNLHFHDPVSPDQLEHYAAQHDIGLCLESPVIVNRDLCTTNKIFLYCQAGLYVIASDTQGQQDVFDRTPEIGAMYEADSSESLRQVLQALAEDGRLIENGKLAALNAARTLWNWERESEKLVAFVTQNMEKTTT